MPRMPMTSRRAAASASGTVAPAEAANSACSAPRSPRPRPWREATEMRTYKVLSALLGYPDGALLAAANDMRAVLDAENCLPSAVRAGIEALIRRLETVEPLTLQEEYVALFDRGRS